MTQDVATQEFAGLLTRALGEKGVLINDVIEGGPADLAGLQAGDVRLTVGDVEVDSADTAARALSPTGVGAATTVRAPERSRPVLRRD